jgi:hypothetical protein
MLDVVQVNFIPKGNNKPKTNVKKSGSLTDNKYRIKNKQPRFSYSGNRNKQEKINSLVAKKFQPIF